MTAVSRYECITCKVRNCSFLNNCDTHTLKLISTYKVSRSIKKGEKLFSEGDEVMGVYFIKKGFLRIELNGKVDRPLVLKFAGKGTVLGHRTNINHSAHHSTATAITDVAYCFIPAMAFRDITCDSPTLRQQIVDQLLRELILTEKKTLQLAHKSVREKVAEALLQITNIHGYDDRKQSFRTSFCRQDIADLAGTTKEQVSKIMKDFEKERLIKYTGKRFNYINLNQLRSIVDDSNHAIRE